MDIHGKTIENLEREIFSHKNIVPKERRVKMIIEGLLKMHIIEAFQQKKET